MVAAAAAGGVVGSVITVKLLVDFDAAIGAAVDAINQFRIHAWRPTPREWAEARAGAVRLLRSL